MKLFQEFKEFAVKGNMMDMAIGIIIGAAFNSVIDVLVKQVLMPPLSLLSGSISLDSKKWILRELVQDSQGAIITEEVAIHYGLLLETMLDFLIVGFTIFIVVKAMNRLRTKAQDTKDETVVTPKDIELLNHISELMEEQNKLLKNNS
ncbi:MAG: large conductance mechanosensitive channel protein MscL [bacterium]